MIPPLSTDPHPWSVTVRLSEVQRASPTLSLSPDDAQRATLAHVLDLVELTRLSAEVRLTPWLDGAEIRGRWSADIVQTCSVTADPLPATLQAEFTVRAVPADSPAAVADESDVAVDPEADDPPDILEGDQIDVAAYVVEHLALEIDPFPRKPGAEFEPPPEERPASPFAVLKTLAERTGGADGGKD
jgi:uncharacterized metal-binding protein YceD (DUF177 family)